MNLSEELQRQQTEMKLGSVTSLRDDNTAVIRFDEDTNPSGKSYSYLNSYAPKQGDRVLLAPMGNTYIILGAVLFNESPQGSLVTEADVREIAGDLDDGVLESVAETYLSKTDAGSAYLSKTDASSTYLTKTNAGNTYLTQTSASSTYLPKTDASNTYLSKTDASNTYLSKTDASSTYLSKSTASSTYLSKTDASNTYLTKTDASSTYSPTTHTHDSLTYKTSTTTYKASLNQLNFVPGSTSSYSLGTSTAKWKDLYLSGDSYLGAENKSAVNISNGTIKTGGSTTQSIGFFGTAPVVKKTVSKCSTSATTSGIITTLNNLITALNGYGLIKV